MFNKMAEISFDDLEIEPQICDLETPVQFYRLGDRRGGGW